MVMRPRSALLLHENLAFSTPQWGRGAPSPPAPYPPLRMCNRGLTVVPSLPLQTSHPMVTVTGLPSQRHWGQAGLGAMTLADPVGAGHLCSNETRTLKHIGLGKQACDGAVAGGAVGIRALFRSGKPRRGRDGVLGALSLQGIHATQAGPWPVPESWLLPQK